MVVPGRYFYKSVKWLERVEALAEDRLGYWEAETGYHNNADPWPAVEYRAVGRSTLNLRRPTRSGAAPAGSRLRRPAIGRNLAASQEGGKPEVDASVE